MNEKDKVLARVKKMMTLANDKAATEGERDTALRMVHTLLAKYNLTMGEATAAPENEDPRVRNAFDVGHDYAWKRTAASAIGDLFFCQYFFSQPRGGGWKSVKHYFVGKTSNVMTAQEMARYVIASIDREARAAAKAAGHGTGPGNYWRSFCKGAAYRVHQRCAEIRRNAEMVSKQEASSGTSLVLASVYAVEEAANRAMIPDMKFAKNRERSTSYEAAMAGKAYGDKIGLHSQVSGKTTERKAIR